jgi:hypothetical protein
MTNYKIYREVDGQRIEGRLMLVIENHYLCRIAPLVVFADGMVDCEGL